MNKTNIRILAIDDINDNLISLKALIKEAFPEAIILTALSGLKGIELAAKEDPDVILLDIVMPVVDGFEVCEKLKKDRTLSDIPVIFLTALKDDKEIRIRALESGAEGFLSKPIDQSELTAQIRAMAKIKAANLNKRDEKERLKELVSQRTKDLEKELKEHKKTALRLQETRVKHQTLVEQASDGIFIADSLGNYVDVNEAGCHMLGYTLKELLNLNMKDLIAPEDQAKVPLKLGELRQGKTVISEREMVRKDGTVLPVEISGKMMADGRFQGIVRDISERKMADNALVQSEEKFRKAFLTSPDSININRLEDGMYIQINKGFTQIMGYSEEEVIGKTSLELNIWKNPKDREKLIKGLKSKGYIENLEAEFNLKNGESKYGLMSAAIIELDGEPHILSITRDITERNLAEERIRKIGRHYQALIEHAPDGIALVNAEGKFRFVSPSAKKIFGYDVSDEISKEPNELTHPDDREFVLSELAKLFEDPSYTPTLQYRFADRNGKWKWIESTFTNLLADPDVESIIINFRDINERKITEMALVESERLLRESQIIAGLGSYVWNISTGLWSSSKVLDGIFGIDQNYVRSLEGWVKIVHPKWQDKMAKYVANEVLGKHQRFDKEYKIIRQDNGQESWVHGLGELEQDTINQSMILIGTIKDITKQKHAEEEILKLNVELEERVLKRTAQLEAINKEMEAFSYSVSHDLRAPLRHINGFINLFLENKSTQLTEEELGYLTTVTNSAGEMGRLIDALLTFSRLHRADLQKTLIDTQQLLQLGIRFFQPEIKTRKIEFSIRELHETYGDLQLIRQVWINLLSNALKYTSKKELAKIEIGSYHENNEIIFFIKDNGAGFDMKYADKLFGVFQRLHKPRDFEGIGIGLANVKRIVTRHGGRCWAEGEVGKGAAFYFSLPGENI